MKPSSILVTLALVLLEASQAGAQTANAQSAPGSPTADHLPIYVAIQRGSIRTTGSGETSEGSFVVDERAPLGASHAIGLTPRGDAAISLIEGHDEFGPVGASALLDHQEALAVGGDVVSRLLLPGAASSRARSRGQGSSNLGWPR